MQSRIEEVERAISTIQEFYKLGTEIPKPNRHQSTYGKKQIDELARKRNINGDTLRKARQLAASFTPDELNVLCGQVRSIQGSQDAKMRVFGRSHLVRLLTIQPKAKRESFFKKALMGGWSLKRFNEEITKKFGARKQGGRRKQIAKDLPTFLGQIEKTCQTWRRWVEVISKTEKEVNGSHATLGALPDNIRERIVGVTTLIDQLQVEIEAELSKKNPGRVTRSLREESE